MSKKIATLFDSKREPSGSSDDGDDEHRQSFYTGGEKSGQQVLGPAGSKGPDDLVDKVFEKAKKGGAEVVDKEAEASAEREASTISFQGAGRRLEDGTMMGTAQSGTAQSSEASVEVSFWSDGISIDDGPLRELSDPTTQAFMDSIMKGKIPSELLQKHPGKQIKLDLINKKGEAYKPPKMKPFSGQGQRLGDMVPGVVGETPKDEGLVERQNSSSPKVPEIPVDESKPVTTIQIRLADGQRLVARLNADSTIRALRDFIVEARPEFAFQIFVLMTAFPKKELENEDATLEEAKLLNSTVIQHLKK